MQNISAIEKFDNLRYNYFSWRSKTNIAYKIMLVFAMAAFSGLAAQLKIYIPGTPVPISGQTFTAALSGVLLGSVWGGASQIVYILLGLAGIPWFAGAKAGLAVLAGPTGGYLIGFVIESLFLGYIIDNFVKSRKFFVIAALIIIADYLFIFGCGMLQLNLWFKYAMNTELTFSQTLAKGLLPFVPGEIVKMLCAASVITLITPKKAYK